MPDTRIDTSPICEGIYWVHENGTLIAKAGRKKKADDLVMAMLNAVRSYTKNVLEEQLKIISEIPSDTQIEYGYATIYDHKADYTDIVSIFVGIVPKNHRSKLRNVQDHLERQYIKVLPNWDGDRSVFNLPNVRKELKTLEPKRKK